MVTQTFLKWYGIHHKLDHMPNHCEYKLSMYVHANDHMSPPVTSQDIGGQWSVRKEDEDAST